jgi:catechol 2,3-dioxygenase-like lactoylglutathione lyase family enzyme
MSETSSAAQTAPKLEFIGVIHEGIPVEPDKLEACIAFYRDVLGLKQIPRPPALDKMGTGAWLTDEDERVQFHLISNAGAVKPGEGAKIEPAGRHTAWRIRDAATFRARMDALGVDYGEIGALIGEPQLFVIDPQGHTWEFQEVSKAK